jgi:outer membrane protein TolC
MTAIDVAPAMAEAHSVTLTEAFALANEHSLTLKASRSQLEGARDGLQAVQAARWPSLTAAAGANNVGPQSSSGTGGLTVAYDLDTSGARGTRIQVSEHQSQLAKLDLERTAMEVRFAVVGAYYDLQTAAEQERIAGLTLKNAEISLHDAGSMRQAGEGTAFDVQRSEVQLAVAQQSLADAEAAHSNGRRALARTLGLGADDEIEAKDPVVPASEWSGDLEANVTRALLRRPDLGQRKIQLEIAQLQGKLAQAANRPQTQVQAGGNYAAAFGAPSGAPTGPGVSVGANAQWLLIDGGAARNAERQAAAAAGTAQAQYDDTVLQIRLEIQQARSSLAAARRNILTADHGLKMALGGLDAARQRFKGGVGTQTDVLLAQGDLANAEASRLKAIIGFNRAHAALERAVDAAGMDQEMAK